jgi:hypothetical protein
MFSTCFYTHSCSGDDRTDPADHAAGAHQTQAGGAEGELQAASGRASQTGRYGTLSSRSVSVSGSDFLARYGSGSASQKVRVRFKRNLEEQKENYRRRQG